MENGAVTTFRGRILEILDANFEPKKSCFKVQESFLWGQKLQTSTNFEASVKRVGTLIYHSNTCHGSCLKQTPAMRRFCSPFSGDYWIYVHEWQTPKS